MVFVFFKSKGLISSPGVFISSSSNNELKARCGKDKANGCYRIRDLLKDGGLPRQQACSLFSMAMSSVWHSSTWPLVSQALARSDRLR